MHSLSRTAADPTALSASPRSANLLMAGAAGVVPSWDERGTLVRAAGYGQASAAGTLTDDQNSLSRE